MITIVGENVADLIPSIEGTLRVALGGGPANTAVAAARLGGDVQFLGRFGSDAFADQFRARLAAAGVDLTRAHTVDASSSVALASIGPTGVARYDFWLTGAADFEATELADPAPGDVLHTGSLGAYWAPGADVTEAWLARWRAAATITFDVNLRPIVLARQPGALDRLDRLVRLAHVVKASDEDTALAYPGSDPYEVAASWLSLGPELVVLTHGADGASAHVPGRPPVMVGAPHIELADTIGAGDAAMGALLVAVAAQGVAHVIADIANTLRYVCAAAAVACTRPGAYAPNPADVAALLAADLTPPTSAPGTDALLD
jgi:fructokinase